MRTREDKQAYERAYYEKMRADPNFRLRVLLKQIRQKSRQRALPCTIDAEWALQRFAEQEGRCARSGLPFVLDDACVATSVSFDQIEPAQGYTRENVQLVIGMYNFAKNGVTDAEVLEMCVGVCEQAGYTVSRE